MTVTSTLSLNLSVPPIGPLNSVSAGTQTGGEVISLANGAGVAFVYRSVFGDEAPVLEIAAGPIQTISLAPLGTVFDMVGDPDVIQLSNGNIVVAWAGGPSSTNGNDLFGVIVDPVTHAVVKDVFFLPSNTIAGTEPALTALTDGKWMVAFKNTGGDVRVQIMNADGSRLGSEIDVSASQNGEHEPAVTALAGGGFVVAYTQTDTANNDLDVMAAVYNSAGVEVKAPFEVGGLINTEQSQSAIVGLKNGGFAIALLSTGTSDPNITVKTFNAAGTEIGDRYIPHPDLAGDPDITVLPNGDIFVTATFQVGAHPAIQGYVLDVKADGSLGLAIETSINDGPKSIELPLANFGGFDFSDSSTAMSTGGDIVSVFTFQGNGVFAAQGNFFTQHVGDGAADLVVGDDLRDIAEMGGGNDTALGRGGDDQLVGAAGQDTLLGDAGDDFISGGADADVMTGGDGTDTLAYSDSSAGVSINLATGAASGGFAAGDLFVGFEDIQGSTFADTLAGRAGANELVGLGGNDTFVLGAEAQGVDTVVEEESGGTADTITSTITRSLVAYENVERLTLLGTLAINGTGSAGNNTIIGNGARNILSGGTGAGIDTLIGGLGRDRMTGGLGNDIFKFNAITESGITTAQRDIITDFSHLHDKINLVGIDAKANVANNNAFSAAIVHGTAATAFTGQGKIIWYQQNLAGTANDKTIIRLNVDADAANDMTIELKGLINLTAGDFIF